MPPRVRKKYRVMWEDLGGDGHYLDVDAENLEEAAWKVAISLEAATFKGIFSVPADS